MRSSLLFSLLLLITGCARLTTSSASQYEKANNLFRSGRLNAALAFLNGDAASYVQGSDPAWKIPFRTLKAEVLLSQGQNVNEQELLGEVSSDPRWEARRQILLGALAWKRNDFAQSAEHLATGRKLAEKAGDASTALQARIWDGIRAFRAGDLAGAESTYQAALADAERQQDLYNQASALGNLTVVRLKQDRFDDAIATSERAYAAAERAGSLWMAARTAGNIGTTYVQLGDIPRASEWQKKALSMAEQIGDVHARMNALGEMGSLLLVERKINEAVPYYQQAIGLARESNDDASVWANNLTTAYIEAENWDEAEKWNQESGKIAKTPDKASRLYQELNSAAVSLGRMRLAEAEAGFRGILQDSNADSTVRWGSEAGLARVAMAKQDFPLARKHFDAALKIIEASRKSLSRNESKITFLARLMHFYQDYVEALMTRHETEAALVVAESSRGRIFAERSGRAVESVNAGIVEKSKRFCAANRTVVLYYWIAPRQSYVWRIDSSGVRASVLQASSWIDARALAYRKLIETSRKNPLQDPGAAELSAELLKPVKSEGDSRLIVIPDGALNFLNFESLPVAAPSPHYWIQDATIAISPSLSMLSDTAQSSGGRDSILLVGASIAPQSKLPPLPNAKAELSEIATLFGQSASTVLEGTQATGASFGASHPDQFGFIHFATHAEAGRLSPLDSAIILSSPGDNFRLYAREILAMPKLNAQLVTISACRSAGTMSYAGEGLVGLAWTFLQAGARSVVAGLWDVSDVSSASLMPSIYARIHQGTTPVEALRAAKLELLAKSDFQSPYYWAPFQVYVRAPDFRPLKISSLR